MTMCLMEPEATEQRLCETTDDWAEAMGLDRRTIHALIRQRRIPAPMPLGIRVFRWPPGTIEKYLREHGANT